ncbi:MAG: signal peptidase II [Actinomycetota bacterium]|nr:signal peptidase II [Actinomycetota bacterium]MEC8982953.1 signal peptidase II [Actinomycetota bacterium]MEC9426223.1 signal peptidase II [Actinomycetota bacterium]MEC9449775.1 signal peptidase II [Actinomycetota bacterium]MED5438428.1 signal peptidase II [Actinomycetota bacterium]|tara:strand:- start:317 stop:754 length:438 start_codon:yes stop_codon:yes gene_type:complete
MVPALAGAAVLLLDQLTKWWASEALADRTIDLVWTLRLHLVFNTGAAFSQGEGWGPLFAVLILLVVALLVRQGAGTDDPMTRIAVGVVIGGAIGNLADRAFREGGGFFGGAVIDFIDLQWWPVFNVADSAIVVGGVLVVWRGWRR